MKQIKVYITAEQWAEKRLQVFCSPIHFQVKFKGYELDKIIEQCGFELIETETKPEQPQPSEIPTDKVEAVKYFLNQLPEGYRQRALAQVDESDVVRWGHCKKMEEAIEAFAIWDLTKEGYAFWSQIHMFYMNPVDFKTLPPLPND